MPLRPFPQLLERHRFAEAEKHLRESTQNFWDGRMNNLMSLETQSDVQIVGIVQEPAPQYHAHPAVSRTGLKLFRERRTLYHHEFILHDAPAGKSTKPMDMGTLGHAGLLEPERFESLYVLYPRDILGSNGAVSTNEAKQFRDDHRKAGRISVKPHELDAVRCMVESVKRKVGHWLKREHKVEHSIYWTDKETGLPCRSRNDWLIEQRVGGIIIDLKGTGDVSPDQFVRRARDGALWLQDAHYRAGAADALACEVDEVEFYFLAVEWEFPYTTVMYKLPESKAVKAARAREQLMRQVSLCLESGDWREPWELEIQPLDLHDSCFE